MPLVTVIIPNYNQSQYVSDAILSVLSQSHRKFEIIVVDDGSTDDSGEVINRFRGQVKYVRQENQGLAGARNTGLRAARGEWIGLLDADDQWSPAYLEQMTPLINQYPDAVAFYCMARCMDVDGHDLPQLVGGPPVQATPLYWRLLRANFIIPSTVMFRREPVMALGAFDPDLRSCEDWDLWLRLLRNQSIVGSSKCLVRYRVHGNSLSANLEGMHSATRKVIQKNFGSDDGEPSGWAREKRRAYGGAYRYQVITLISRQNNWEDSVFPFQRALQIDPSLAQDLDLFYELALGSQPIGYRGVPGFQVAENNASQVEKLIFNAFAASEAKSIRNRAFGTALYALGLVCYNNGKRPLSRGYFVRALCHRPELIFDRRLTGDYLKAFISDGRIKRIRKIAKHAL